MIKEYLLRIVSASIICSIVNVIFQKSTAYGSIIKLLSRIFLIIALLSPLLKLDFSHILDSGDAFSIEAESIIKDGENLSNAALRNSIKEQSEAYILNKATDMNVSLTVEVTVSEDFPPAPISVVLQGRISPNAKSKLSQLIFDDLGISKENQKWK